MMQKHRSAYPYARKTKKNRTESKDAFPFHAFFATAPQPLFAEELDALEVVETCFRHIEKTFVELEEVRPFELLRTNTERSNYLLTKEAKVVAMTCTHAALKRSDFLRVDLTYDTLIMEEAAQVLEIENFIPLTMQRDGNKLKRIILIGDHMQLPPVIQNVAFQRYANMDQSMFSRLIKLGVPSIQLNRQGRARPSIARLYSWRYKELEDLETVKQKTEFNLANAGFAHPYQVIDVPDFKGEGETEPTKHFIQNLGEAEYVVATYQYMRLLG